MNDIDETSNGPRAGSAAEDAVRDTARDTAREAAWDGAALRRLITESAGGAFSTGDVGDTTGADGTDAAEGADAVTNVDGTAAVPGRDGGMPSDAAWQDLATALNTARASRPAPRPAPDAALAAYRDALRSAPPAAGRGGVQGALARLRRRLGRPGRTRTGVLAGALVAALRRPGAVERPADESVPQQHIRQRRARPARAPSRGPAARLPAAGRRRPRCRRIQVVPDVLGTSCQSARRAFVCVTSSIS